MDTIRPQQQKENHIMTPKELKLYKHPASVICFEIPQSDYVSHWGYGFRDMLERERTLKDIGTIKRIITTTETVWQNRWTDGSRHPEITCWALVELESQRIIEIKAKVVQTVIDPVLFETIETGKPKAKRALQKTK